MGLFLLLVVEIEEDVFIFRLFRESNGFGDFDF